MPIEARPRRVPSPIVHVIGAEIVLAGRDLLLRLKFPVAIIADDHFAERLVVEEKLNVGARIACARQRDSAGVGTVS